MSEIFFVADTHFGHRNIIKFQDTRPFASIEEHDEALVELWNSVVGKRDVVYHLGDTVFGKRNLPILERLRGHKRLILGNHDQYRITEYLRYFKKVRAVHVYQVLPEVRAVLSHIPIHPQQLESRFQLNIHGHLHQTCLDDSRYVNVCCDHTGLKPVNLDAIKETLPL